MKNQFKSGFFYTALAQYSTIVIQLIINMILARLLSPAQIGTVTIVQVLAFFFQLLAGPAIGPAIVQNKKLTKQDYGVILNYTLLLGLALALLFGLGGSLFFSVFYGDPVYTALCWSLAPLIIFSAVSAVPNGVLYKDKRFKDIGLRLIVSWLIGAVVGIGAALLHAGVYALILVFTIPEFVALLLNLKMARIPYSRSLNPAPLREIFPFVKHQTFFSFINYFYRNLDNLLVGKFMGAAALGNYAKSYQLLSAPVTLILSVVTPVMQPVLAEHETETALIRSVYLKSSQLLALIAIPLSVFLSLNAGPIVYLLFGGQWTAAIAPLSVISLSIWAQILAQSLSPIWLARNQARLQSANGLISLGIIGSAIILSLFTGNITGVAVGVAVAYTLNFLVSAAFLLRKTLEGTLTQLLRVLVKPLATGLLLYLALCFLQPPLTFSNAFLTLFLHALLWAVLTLSFLWISRDLRMIKELFRREG